MKRRNVCFLALLICFLAAVWVTAAAEDVVPPELQGEWTVREMTDENGDDAMGELLGLGGSVTMQMNGYSRVITVSVLGIENTSEERLFANQDGQFISDTGRMIAWRTNRAGNILLMEDDTGVRILAGRPDTDWENAEIPELPSFSAEALYGDWVLIDLQEGISGQYELARYLAGGGSFAERLSISEQQIQDYNAVRESTATYGTWAVKSRQICIYAEGGEEIAETWQYQLADDILWITRGGQKKGFARTGTPREQAALRELAVLAETGYFDYEENGNAVRITGYTGPREQLPVPAELNGLPVTAIAASALDGAPQIAELTIPVSVSDIGAQSLPMLRRIILEVGNGTFVLRDGVLYSADGSTLILYPAADSRDSYEIPEGTVWISTGAFANAKNLKNVGFPSSLQTIQGGAFRGCAGLAEIRLPDSLAAVGSYAFSGCGSLRKVTIAYCDSLNLNSRVFDGCDALTEIHTAPGMYAAELLAAEGWTVITDQPQYHTKSENGTVTLYGTLEEESWSLEMTGNDGVLSATADFRKTCMDDGMPWAEYRERITCVRMYGTRGGTSWSVGTDGKLTLAGTGPMGWFMRDDGPDDVVYDAPWGSWTVTSAEIGEGLTSVSRSALYGTQIETIRIPAGVTSIDRDAFRNCASLRTAELPEGLEEIGYNAFAGCAALEDIRLPETLARIGYGAFNGCAGLRVLALPEGITEIADRAFSGCAGLTAVTLPDSLVSAGVSAFQGCSGLAEVNIGNGLTAVSDYMFSGCTALRELTVPDQVTAIGEGAFSGCTALESLRIPESVTRIGENAVSGCAALPGISCEPESFAAQWAALFGVTALNERGEPIGRAAQGQTGEAGKEPVTKIAFSGWLSDSHGLNMLNEDVKVHFYMELLADGSATLSEAMPEGGDSYQGTWRLDGNRIEYSFGAGNGLEGPIEIYAPGKARVSFYGEQVEIRLPAETDEFLAWAVPGYTPAGSAGSESAGEPDGGTAPGAGAAAGADRPEDVPNDYFLYIANEEYAMGYQAYATPETGGEPAFAFYDIDGNGIPEMIAYNGFESHADASCYAYTWKDGIVYLGTAGGEPGTLYYYENSGYPGLFYSDGWGGYDITEYITLRGTELTWSEVFSTDLDLETYETIYNQATDDDALYALVRSETPRARLHFMTRSEIVEMGGTLFYDAVYGTAGSGNAPQQAATEPPEATPEPVPQFTRPIPGYSGVLQIDVLSVNATSWIVNSQDPNAFIPSKMIDGNEETCFQFSTQATPLGQEYLYFEFPQSVRTDGLWIKNGFWKYTNGNDQYVSNCRIKQMTVEFRFEGGGNYGDPAVYILEDDKTRADWIRLDLGGKQNVTGIRIRVDSVYKGSKFKTDVCVSEIMFVQNGQ